MPSRRRAPCSPILQAASAVLDIVFTLATPADSALLIELEASAFGDRRWPGQSIGEAMNAPNTYVLLAHIDGDDEATRACAGFLIWHQHTDEVEILSLGTQPHWQRRGIAQKLLAELENQMKIASKSRIILDVSTLNSPALALYRGAGYHEIGLRKKYYRDTSDAVVMAKALT